MNRLEWPGRSELQDRTRAYYDQLAGEYDRTVDDWRGAVVRQGSVLDWVIRARTGDRAHIVLDCSCGIGTQAIGLALHGHTVTGTDLSAAAVDRARHEARSFHTRAAFAVADMRELAALAGGPNDVVLTCDNSITHLLTDDDLERAISGMRAQLRPGGLLLIGIRDYDRHLRRRPLATLPSVLHGDDGERIMFSRWTWLDDTRYLSRLFVLEQAGSGWTTRTLGETVYRALPRDDLAAQVSRCGFAAVEWLMPPATGFHQPLLVATAP